MSVSALYELKLDVSETIALSLDLVSDQTFQHTISGDSGTLNSTSSPVATKAWSDNVQLSTGAATLDLTSLSRGAVLSSVDFTGLKVQMIKIKAASANTDTITIVDGATNGYNIFGDSSGSITLGGGDVVMLSYNETLPDVSSSVKTIDISSSDADAIFSIILVAG